MKKILIVDDSAFMRSILRDLLTDKSSGIHLKEEVELYEADGKNNALRMFKKIKPDAILLDVVMQESEREGIEFIEEIKDIFNTKKIIMISSVGQPSIIEECKTYGIVHYLQKPFEHDQVVEVVNQVLK